MSGEPTRPRSPNLLPAWQPGQSGNPAGRPKGARAKLGEAFIEALHQDFGKHGIAAIEEVRKDKPDQYLKVIASLMPKELNLNFTDDQNELTDDELVQRIRALSEAIAPLLTGGTNAASEAVGDPASPLLTSRVH